MRLQLGRSPLTQPRHRAPRCPLCAATLLFVKRCSSRSATWATPSPRHGVGGPLQRCAFSRFRARRPASRVGLANTCRARCLAILVGDGAVRAGTGWPPAAAMWMSAIHILPINVSGQGCCCSRCRLPCQAPGGLHAWARTRRRLSCAHEVAVQQSPPATGMRPFRHCRGRHA